LSSDGRRNGSYQNARTAKLIAVRDPSHRNTQPKIASEAGFANANIMIFLKNVRNKEPLDCVPSLAKALEVDPAMLMRLALDLAVGATAAQVITEIFGATVTQKERRWLAEIRDVRTTETRAHCAQGVFGKWPVIFVSTTRGAACPLGPRDRFG